MNMRILSLSSLLLIVSCMQGFQDFDEKKFYQEKLKETEKLLKATKEGYPEKNKKVDSLAESKIYEQRNDEYNNAHNNYQQCLLQDFGLSQLIGCSDSWKTYDQSKMAMIQSLNNLFNTPEYKEYASCRDQSLYLDNTINYLKKIVNGQQHPLAVKEELIRSQLTEEYTQLTAIIEKAEAHKKQSLPSNNIPSTQLKNS